MNDPERDYRARFVFDVLKRSGQTEFDRLIDFGCGDGRVMNALKGLVNAKQAFGVDVNAPVDGETEPHAEPDTVRFCRTNLLQFQPAEKFDLVISNQVFEHIYEPWLADYFAVLKDSCEPGGTIVISTPNRWRPKNIMRALTLRSPHMMCANPGVPPEMHTGHHRECSYRELRSIFAAHFPESCWQIQIAMFKQPAAVRYRTNFGRNDCG